MRDSRAEGPFGEWTGYYASGTRNEPVVKVKNVFIETIRSSSACRPASPGKSVALSAANVWLALEKAGVTDVQGVWEYQTRYITVISLKQKYGGHVKRAAMAMLGIDLRLSSRVFVIHCRRRRRSVDIDDVLWALATRCDPATAIGVINEAWTRRSTRASRRMRAAARKFTNSVAIIDAASRSLERSVRQNLLLSGETRRKALEKWKDVLRLE